MPKRKRFEVIPLFSKNIFVKEYEEIKPINFLTKIL